MSNTIYNNLKYIELHTGGAFLFTLKDGTLSASGSGKIYKLTESLTGKVSRFDVCTKVVNNKTQVRMMAVVQRGESVDFYLSSWFEPTDTNLIAFDQWTSHPTDQLLAITSAKIGPIAVSEYGMAFAVNHTGSDAFYCVFDIGTNKWVKYNIPENAPTIEHLIFGTVYGNGGLFLLLIIDGSETLMFQSFIDPTYGKTSDYRYDCSGKTIRKLTSVKTADNATQLYAMYDKGIFLFKTPDSEREDVFTPEADFLIEDFTVHQLESQAKSFVVLEIEDLQYSHNKKANHNLNYQSSMFPNMNFCLTW
jgi:hypothetical protein